MLLRPATPLLERPAVEISDAVLLRLRQGFKPGQSHPLMHAVAAAIGRAVDDLGAVDQENLRIADSMLGTSTLRMVSQFAFAESLGISRRRVAPRIRSIFSSAFIMSRVSRWKLEEQISRQHRTIQGIVNIDYARYDETPLRVKSVGASSIDVAFATSDAAGVAGGGVTRTMLRDMPGGQSFLDHELPSATGASPEPSTAY